MKNFMLLPNGNKHTMVNTHPDALIFAKKKHNSPKVCLHYVNDEKWADVDATDIIFPELDGFVNVCENDFNWMINEKAIYSVTHICDGYLVEFLPVFGIPNVIVKLTSAFGFTTSPKAI